MQKHILEAVSGLALCSFLLLAPAAKAEPVVLVCAGQEKTKYTPGLTYAQRQVSFTGQADLDCPLLTPAVGTATIKTSGSSMQSCTPALTSASSQITIDWGDGTRSVARGSTVLSTKPLGESVITLTGTVVSGRFKDATIVRTLTLLAPDPALCNTSQGVTQVEGPSTLEVLKLF
ncbi:hypothetical protein OV208_04200 [Corallococcus sp. bb12-1]|uniref:hypothetical protein n=1 Tax=Corallococcus sp. bb12-1 TaxID=2996784 RepID=UPI00226F1C86|nr:hypothetical protein [Corallococcus sp. bb12-1]MCY1040515.1 hypothetical protein [Corallococcus sp. bb12-1]